jgi:hypothetical protein
MNKILLRGELLRLICFLILACAIFVLMYVAGKAPIKKNELGDSDCYMRLVRVSELYHSGRWYDAVISRSNAPYGENSHWTRPFDVLLLAGAVPLSHFTDFKTALFWWGVIISPVLLIGAIVALQWAVRPILKGDGPFLAGLILVFQMIIFAYFQPGRPDHHSFIVFLFVLSIGFAFRMILRPFNAFLCYLAGAVGALSIWVSVESILPVFIIIAALGVLWIVKNEDFAKKSLHYSLALFIFTSLSLVLERPWHDLATKQLDRISIVHVSVLGFIAAFWIMNAILGRYDGLYHRVSHRFSFALAGSAAIAFAVLLCFPKFYHGPFADIDLRIVPIWLSKVKEVQPLMSTSAYVFQVQLFGSVVLAVVFFIYLMLSKSYNGNRDGWLFILFAAVIFILVAFYQIRWTVYAQILLIIPMTALMILLRQKGPKAGFLKTLKNTSIVFIFCMGFLILGLLAEVIFKKADSEKSSQKVSLIRMCKYLDETEQFQKGNCRILTYIDYGAEILYRTPYEVIGTPYHRNSAGILDTYDIMTADTDKKAHEIVQKRKINLILLGPESSESKVYSKSEQTSTFLQRLREGIIPNWLKKIELPSDLSSSFLLFETTE